MRKRRKRNRSAPAQVKMPQEAARQVGETTQRSEEVTQPLPNVRALVFEGFLARHHLSMLDVARAAEVRLVTVWRVMRDLPVSEQQAAQVYAGLYRLAGVHYRGRIRLHAAGDELHATRGSRKAGGK